jgi:hypothetical protein
MNYEISWNLLKEHITEHAADLEELINKQCILLDCVQYAKGSLDVCKMVIAMMTAVES